MLPEKTIHFVNGQQLSDQQYAYFRENTAYRQGYQNAVHEIDQARRRIGKRFWESLTWQQIKEKANSR